MAVQILCLGNGQLTTSTGDLYKSPISPPDEASLTTIVKGIRLVNTGTVPRTVNLYFLPNSGTARRIAAKDMTIAAGALAVDDQEITMGPGDKIQGDASANSAIDYVISGIQR